ncbi:MAG: hypothetical protein D6797_09145 [Bdellovibrio sp.]|nr:MAG: hypothetical protein D6797_09145 [Bdellovibrio sp.]
MRKIAEEQEALIEVFPYGVTMGLDFERPVVLFQDEEGKYTVPVWASQASIHYLLSGLSYQSLREESGHEVTWKALGRLGICLEKCVFHKVSGNQQYMDLYFTGSDQLRKLESRADKALPFCLSVSSRYFVTAHFMESCREIESSSLDVLLAGNKEGNDFYYYMN